MQNNKTNMTKNRDKLVNCDTPSQGLCPCNAILPLPLRRPVHATAYEYVIYLLYESVLIFEQLKEQKKHIIIIIIIIIIDLLCFINENH